jgi:hypothetical protein
VSAKDEDEDEGEDEDEDEDEMSEPTDPFSDTTIANVSVKHACFTFRDAMPDLNASSRVAVCTSPPPNASIGAPIAAHSWPDPQTYMPPS